MSYSEKLKDPRWQKMRLRVLEYAKFRCQMCGSSRRTLHIHHSYYVPKKMPWQYYIGSLIALCDKCHDCFHRSEPPKVEEQTDFDSRPLSPEVLRKRFAELRANLSKL